MKAIWTLPALVALLAVVAAPAPAYSQEKDKGTVEKAKDAVVDTSKKVADKTVDTTKTVVDKTKEGLSKTGEVMTDGWITTRVNARFVDESLLKDSDINVDTAKHVVTLRGTVPTTAGRRKATTVARGTEGVHSVVNRLTIGPKKQS